MDADADGNADRAKRPRLDKFHEIHHLADRFCVLSPL